MRAGEFIPVCGLVGAQRDSDGRFWINETLHTGFSGNIPSVIAAVESGADQEIRAIKKRFVCATGTPGTR